MSRRVALLGGAGAFSEEAAEAILGTGWTAVPAPDLPTVTALIGRGEAEVAVLPVENSIAGEVEEAWEGWREQKLFAFAEGALAVRQHLLALPGVALEEIREVWSHPQALAQCAPYLRDRGFTAMPAPSTVAAAERVTSQRQRHLAAIGSARTAQRWGLSVLAPDVQAVPENFTRFVAVSAAPDAAPTGRDKTALALEPREATPGLAAIFEILEAHRIRVLRLHARPIATRLWRQRFYLEVSGHAQEAPLATALPLIESRTAAFQWMGSYPARP